MNRKLFNKKFSFRSFGREFTEYELIISFIFYKFILFTQNSAIYLPQLIDFSYDQFLLHVDELIGIIHRFYNSEHIEIFQVLDFLIQDHQYDQAE